jgi:tetratricopeptide (TPR) repeat protein
MQRLPLVPMALLTLSLGAMAPPARAMQRTSPASPIHAKSQQELADYDADYSLNGGGAMEQAAISFAQKYPESELRLYLFARAMREYQRENNATGIQRMGEKVLALDPDHPIALVLTATALADNLGPSDPDRDKKIAEIKKNATRALQTVRTRFVPPTGATPQQAAVYKTTLEAMAYSALGMTNLKTGDYNEAEKNLKQAAELDKIHPDPYVWYHLALAQDHRKKYPAALNSVEQALQLASSNPDLQKLAETEHQRLSRLATHGKDSPDPGGAPPPQ